MAIRPRRLLVFGKEIKVIYKKLKNCVGLTNFKTIYIKTRLSDSLRTETILHELFHCVIDRTGIGQSNLSSEVEEILVDNLAKVVNENFELIVKEKS